MRKILRFIALTIVFFLFIHGANFAQGFVQSIETDGLSALFGSECIVKLKSGDEITGKFVGGTLINAQISKITVKKDDGEKLKLKPEEIISLHIKTSKLAKLEMISESSSSIKEMLNADFDAIVNREYVIFETALAANKKDTYRLLQLLNPGFDSKIKVFATDDKTASFSINGIPVTGGADRTYLFVKGNQKAQLVKKSSYKKDFSEFFSDCSNMTQAFGNQKIKWNDVAGHVFAYDRFCN